MSITKLNLRKKSQLKDDDIDNGCLRSMVFLEIQKQSQPAVVILPAVLKN